MEFVESFYELINSGEPVVRSWPMVRSLWTPVTCATVYLLFVKWLGPNLMRNRKPFDLRTLMVVYNFTVVAVYVYGLGTNVFYLVTTRDGYEKICTPQRIIKKNHYIYKCAIACWYLYIIKYVEFADTVFFVLRKKFHLITNLHVIHHAVLPAIGFFFIRVETTGLQIIPGGINAFVHILMYSYYGLAAMGPEVQKKLWWKEYLTLVQMGQFVVILLFMLVVPLIGCHTSKHGIYIDLFFATLFLLLFCNFYIKTYRKKPTLKEDHVLSDRLYSFSSK